MILSTIPIPSHKLLYARIKKLPIYAYNYNTMVDKLQIFTQNSKLSRKPYTLKIAAQAAIQN